MRGVGLNREIVENTRESFQDPDLMVPFAVRRQHPAMNQSPILKDEHKVFAG